MKKLSWSLSFLFLVSLNGYAAGWDVPNQALQVKKPPAVGSAAETKDYDTLLEYQSARTPLECKEANKQSFPSAKVFYGPALGILSEEEFQVIETFSEELMETVSHEASPFKKEYARLRPYDHDDRIQPCARKPGGQTSYPSSHAGMGWILGEVLSEIYPENATAIKKQGMRIGELRVLGGVHHPSDIVAGRDLARQILKALRQDDAFVKELKALKTR